MDEKNKEKEEAEEGLGGSMYERRMSTEEKRRNIRNGRRTRNSHRM